MLSKLAAAVVVLALVGCSEVSQIPDAVAPVAQNALPIAGEALQIAADLYRKYCPPGVERPAECESIKPRLNDIIDVYTKTNDVVLKSQ